MRFIWVGICAVALTSCAWKETKFADKFVESDCTFLMECTPEAVLTFLGWGSVEDCMDDRGPEVRTRLEGCTYNKKAARDCVKAIDDAIDANDCPQDGAEPDYYDLCDEVFLDCTDETDDSGV